MFPGILKQDTRWLFGLVCLATDSESCTPECPLDPGFQADTHRPTRTVQSLGRPSVARTLKIPTRWAQVAATAYGAG